MKGIDLNDFIFYYIYSILSQSKLLILWPYHLPFPSKVNQALWICQISSMYHITFPRKIQGVLYNILIQSYICGFLFITLGFSHLPKLLLQQLRQDGDLGSTSPPCSLHIFVWLCHSCNIKKGLMDQ